MLIKLPFLFLIVGATLLMAANTMRWAFNAKGFDDWTVVGFGALVTVYGVATFVVSVAI